MAALLALFRGLPLAWQIGSMVAIGLMIWAFLGHIKHTGVLKERARWEKIVQQEVDRRTKVVQEAMAKAEARAVAAEKLAKERQDEIDLLGDLAKQMPGSDELCIPDDIAERLRNLR